MKKRFAIISLCLLTLASSYAAAQQSLVDDPVAFEQKHFQAQCKEASFSGAFASRIDINNDGLTDVVINEGELTCEGEKGPQCNDDGCPYNFYVQVAEGGYLLIATAQMFGYEMEKRYGNMVLDMKMNPRFCDRSGGDPCVIISRVRGVKFFTISKK
ncbi:hypothetical protein [Oryzifoliimicrobium ureilyticus]|uniref:hypothetical protein n=1 Tax=Oryzifoliimicrobium ureilyticus TaxID=3113724 RepID=UPI0030762ED9